MFIERDLFSTIRKKSVLEAALLWGPRQVGKTTLLDRLDLASRFFLDDLHLRDRARSDPEFFLKDAKFPCLIDEVQYAPELFPQIKLLIDALRRRSLKSGRSGPTLFYLTGSNKTLLDRNMRESLAGRCHLFQLHGLSVKEIFAAYPDASVKELLFKGGFPEVHTRAGLTAKQFYNDYIASFIEKDVALSSGVEKISRFHAVLRLLAARTGQFINVSALANEADVDQKTVQSWIDLLERNSLIHMVPTFSSNLAKRVVKMKKLHFLDTGICARLQGHEYAEPLLNSPQAGSLFESLVYAELVKTRDNFLTDWRIDSWRTKEQHEIDFIVTAGKKTFLIESKLGIRVSKTFILDPEARKVFSGKGEKIIVTAGGPVRNLDRETRIVPVTELAAFLLESCS